MNEASLRKWHRWLGISIVLFVVLQALTGLILNLEDLFEIAAVTGWSKAAAPRLGGFWDCLSNCPCPGPARLGLVGGPDFFKIRQRTGKK